VTQHLDQAQPGRRGRQRRRRLGRGRLFGRSAGLDRVAGAAAADVRYGAVAEAADDAGDREEGLVLFLLSLSVL
jgi:hypothetical protein